MPSTALPSGLESGKDGGAILMPPCLLTSCAPPLIICHVSVSGLSAVRLRRFLTGKRACSMPAHRERNRIRQRESSAQMSTDSSVSSALSAGDPLLIRSSDATKVLRRRTPEGSGVYKLVAISTMAHHPLLHSSTHIHKYINPSIKKPHHSNMSAKTTIFLTGATGTSPHVLL